MDTKTVKQQISFWEAVAKDTKQSIKIQSDQLKTIEQTIKGLKSLLGKETETLVAVDPDLAETMEGLAPRGEQS